MDKLSVLLKSNNYNPHLIWTLTKKFDTIMMISIMMMVLIIMTMTQNQSMILRISKQSSFFIFTQESLTFFIVGKGPFLRNYHGADQTDNRDSQRGGFCNDRTTT